MDWLRQLPAAPRQTYVVHGEPDAADTLRTRIQRELGWMPQETFETGMRKTVRWYLDHADWVAHVVSGEYRQWMERNYGDRT